MVARAAGLTPPTMEQPQYNLFERQKVEADYAPLYDTVGLGTTIWSPLASGILTGKYNAAIPNDSRMTLPGYEWLKDMLASDAGQDKLAKTRALGAIWPTKPACRSRIWRCCGAWTTRASRR